MGSKSTVIENKETGRKKKGFECGMESKGRGWLLLGGWLGKDEEVAESGFGSLATRPFTWSFKLQGNWR